MAPDVCRSDRRGTVRSPTLELHTSSASRIGTATLAPAVRRAAQALNNPVGSRVRVDTVHIWGKLGGSERSTVYLVPFASCSGVGYNTFGAVLDTFSGNY